MSSDGFVGKTRKVLRHDYIRGALGVLLVIFKMVENQLPSPLSLDPSTDT